MSEMVERVARAMYADHRGPEYAALATAEDLENCEGIGFMDFARAAIQAMREPTEAMIESGAHAAYKLRASPDTWPDSMLSVDADEFRECARACQEAMIDEALR